MGLLQKGCHSSHPYAPMVMAIDELRTCFEEGNHVVEYLAKVLPSEFGAACLVNPSSRVEIFCFIMLGFISLVR